MIKKQRSRYYNSIFNTKTGAFARWGRTESEDPILAKSPELLDIEVSTVCHGLGAPCRACYKSNTEHGDNMSLETFKLLFSKLPKTVQQIAFGIGDLDGNPHLWEIFALCRKHGVIPNVTTNGWGLTSSVAENLARYCGAVAVSRYHPQEVCYEAVEKLTAQGMTQVNIHQLVAKETLPQCLTLIDDVSTVPELSKLNAVVFLTLKPKGDRNNLMPVDDLEYKKIIDKCLEKKIRFGFDSCSANRFLRLVKGHPQEEWFKTLSEPCEASLFSGFVNVFGKFYPCSFTENVGKWTTGIDVLKCNDFIEDVWNHPKTLRFRSDLLQQCRDCVLYDLG